MSTATVTGKVGPGDTLTAAVFTGVKSFSVDTEQGILTLVSDQGPNPLAVDISAAATFTVTISSGVYTITIS